LLSIEQAAIAASLVFAGSVLILILGTQLLNWYWLVFLGAAGLVLAAYRLRVRLRSPYTTAQVLDHRLALDDTISTAWHLTRHPEIAETRAGRIQLRQAEAIAAQVDTKAAFPMRIQRSWALALALATVALALFSVRYLVRRDLDFKQSLLPMRFDRLVARIQNSLGRAERAGSADSSSQEKEAVSQQLARTQAGDPRANDVFGVKTPAAPGDSGKPSEGESSLNTSPGDGKPGSDGKRGDAGQNGLTSPASEAKDSANGVAKSSDQGTRSQDSGEPQNESLMSRMKDAVSSLMAKMKPDDASRSPQASTRNAAAPDQDQSQSETSQSQNRTSAAQSPPNGAKADSKSAEQGQATEMAQSAESRSSGNSEHKGASQSKSGIGRQDGGKDLKESEELQSMGKLAEIIGRRSKDISGDMMVEVPSGKQQLRTAYTGKVAQHSDTGGEINRDEIPLVFQQYVREYMERVHREPASAK
jgi:hypothetical protein